MKRYITLIICLSAFIIFGCITDYTLKGVKEGDGILVVSGIISDDETFITLKWSLPLTSDDPVYTTYIDDADVAVECDDGTRFPAEAPAPDDESRKGRYMIRTGKLNPALQYRLKVEIQEKGAKYEYYSDYLHPNITPEIDSVFWTKEARGEPVVIRLATHAPDSAILYYQWSYLEEWEIVSKNWSEFFPYYCWNNERNSDLLLASTENMDFGKVVNIITEVSPYSKKLETLYRITINQNVISKRAYDYFENIKKNAEQTGSIFAPIPSELRGNIACATDPQKLAIGFVDVSTTSKKNIFIDYFDGAFEYRYDDCAVIEFPIEDLAIGPVIPDSLNYYTIFSVKCWPNPCLDCWDEVYWYEICRDGECWDEFYLEEVCQQIIFGDPCFTVIPKDCVDCTYYGTTKKPENWPNNH